MNPSDTSDFVLLGPSHSFASHMKCFTSRAFRLQTLILKINRLYAVPVLDLSSSAGLRAAQHYSEMKSRCFLSRVSEEIVEDLPAAPNPYSGPTTLGGGPTGVHQAFFRPAVAPGWDPGDLVLGGVHCTLDFLVITGSHTAAETQTCAEHWTEPCFITETLTELFLNSEDVESRNTSALSFFTSLLFHFPPSAFTLEANTFILYKLQHADHL